MPTPRDNHVRFRSAAQRIVFERAWGKHFTHYASPAFGYRSGEAALRRAARLLRGLDRAMVASGACARAAYKILAEVQP